MKREEKEARAACYDCGLPYSDPGFHDLIVPNDVWLKISPTSHEGGLLCPSCMCRRAQDAGLEGVPARFASGPFVDGSAYTAGLERAAEIAESMAAGSSVIGTIATRIRAEKNRE